MSSSLLSVVTRECESRHEGPVPTDVMHEPWVESFLAVWLGEEWKDFSVPVAAVPEEMPA